MIKKIFDEPPTKAKKRDQKKRPRMTIHGASLKAANPHGGKRLTSR